MFFHLYFFSLLVEYQLLVVIVLWIFRFPFICLLLIYSVFFILFFPLHRLISVFWHIASNLGSTCANYLTNCTRKNPPTVGIFGTIIGKLNRNINDAIKSHFQFKCSFVWCSKCFMRFNTHFVCATFSSNGKTCNYR